MSDKIENPQAFTSEHIEGKELRDYFAAKAITVLFSGKYAHDDSELTKSAELAYKVADAMLKARSI